MKKSEEKSRELEKFRRIVNDGSPSPVKDLSTPVGSRHPSPIKSALTMSPMKTEKTKNIAQN